MASYLYTGPRSSRLTWLLALGGILWLAMLLTRSHAQITLDGSLGPAGPLAGPHYRIGSELGQTRGGNLFHSFGEFNVPTGGSATFAGPNTIANIVGRVTGGQLSSIDGGLGSEIAGANLYLLNPSGVLFGPNARLEVSGSFHVSTADALRFADGAPFYADPARPSVLTVAPPAAFGFLSGHPAAITARAARSRFLIGRRCRSWAGRCTSEGACSELVAAAYSWRAWPRPGMSCSAPWSWRRISSWMPLRAWGGWRSRRKQPLP